METGGQSVSCDVEGVEWREKVHRDVRSNMECEKDVKKGESRNTVNAVLPLPIKLMAQLPLTEGREVQFLRSSDGHTGGVVYHIGVT